MKPRELLRCCVIAAIVALAAATPAGDFWWMGKDNAFGGSGGQKAQKIAHNGQKKHSGQNGNSGQNDYSENNQVGQNLPQGDQFAGAGNQAVNDYPQQVVQTGAASLPAVQGLPVTQGLPATQGLTSSSSSSSSSGSCPAITSIPPVEECSGRSSNCWSVGQPDVDCVNDALCCFDGCANVCQGGGAITGNATPATNARGQVVKNSQNIPQNVQEATQPQNIPQGTQEAVILPKDTSAGHKVPVASEVLLNVAILPETQSPNKEDFESTQGVASLTKPKKQKPKRRGYGGGSAQQPSSQTRNEQKIVFPVGSHENQGGSITLVQPPNPRPQQIAQVTPARKPQPAPARKPKPAPARKPQPAPVRKQKPAPARKPQPAPARKPKPAPRKPQPAPVRKTQPLPVRKQKPVPVSKPQPAPVRKPQPVEASSNNFQQSQAASRPVAPAELKPYVTCPSAMKCVERPFCDFNGVMTEQPLNNLTPQLEMLRVPLIPCVNRQRDNNVDVCCRDPNYKDPWPDMNGNNGNNGKNVNNGLNVNNANNAVDNGNGAFQDQPVIQNNQRQTQNSVDHNNKTKNKKKNNRKNYG